MESVSEWNLFPFSSVCTFSLFIQRKYLSPESWCTHVGLLISTPFVRCHESFSYSSPLFMRTSQTFSFLHRFSGRRDGKAWAVLSSHHDGWVDFLFRGPKPAEMCEFQELHSFVDSARSGFTQVGMSWNTDELISSKIPQWLGFGLSFDSAEFNWSVQTSDGSVADFLLLLNSAESVTVCGKSIRRKLLAFELHFNPIMSTELHFSSFLHWLKFLPFFSTVPRKVLIDRFESTPEPDEPLQFDDIEIEQEELYDEDQFYKESDISPGPAPKLQGDLTKKNHRVETTAFIATSSISPPQRNRDDSSLQGELFCVCCTVHLINHYLHKNLRPTHPFSY